MALIDIYGNAPKSIVREGLMGFQQGMQANDMMRQRKMLDEQRKQEEQLRAREQGFRQNLGGLLGSFGEYAYTPQGQQELYTRMAQAGYGKEMAGLMGGMPQPPEPQRTPDYEWAHMPGTDQIYSRKSGSFQTMPKPAQTPAPAAPQGWKGERFVRSKDNTMVKVDAKGMDEAGNKVELWTPPARPKPTPTPKAPSPIKGLSGDASKLLSISWTLQDDISAMKQAFEKDFAGSIAGIKSGTNKRLLDIADQIADKVGRLRSGGAVNKDEEARFMRLIATLRGAAFSNAQQAAETLNSLSREGAIIAEAMDPGGEHRKRISATMAPKGPIQKFTKPEEEDEYQAWKKAQGIR